MKMLKFLIINGPNLNLLGIREPNIYGNMTYPKLCEYIKEELSKINIETSFFQSNHEGAIIDRIHEAYNEADGIVINAGAYTHYSYAILDALKSVAIPTAEIHISDINSREEFRKVSVISPACEVFVAGKGYAGYVEAATLLSEKIRSEA